MNDNFMNRPIELFSRLTKLPSMEEVPVLAAQPTGAESTKVSARDALLAAAESLFTERGYSAVSTREIAEAAHVNLGAIQYHFGSKAKLFIATVHRMMHSCASMRAGLNAHEQCSCQADAARKLCTFIHGLLLNVLRPSGPQASRVMCREILSSECSSQDEMFRELVSSVVEEFTRPIRDDLIHVLKVLATDRSEQSLKWSVASIIGQCHFYVTHRPFVEELDRNDISHSPYLEGLAEHIATFSLRGMGCDEKLILSVCKEYFSPLSIVSP
jgi:AcrR family transcriptional regulator